MKGWGALRHAVILVMPEFIENWGTRLSGAGAKDLNLDEAAVVGNAFLLLAREEDEASLFDADDSVVEGAGLPEGMGDSALRFGRCIDSPCYDLASVDEDFEEEEFAWRRRYMVDLVVD